jgi:hypothetical protein
VGAEVTAVEEATCSDACYTGDPFGHESLARLERISEEMEKYIVEHMYKTLLLR